MRLTQLQAFDLFDPDKCNILTCPEDQLYLMKKDILECPACGSELLIGSLEKLETLDEHVSNPNKEPTEKFSFVCPTKWCIAHKLQWCWNSLGDFYSCGNYVPTKQIAWIHGTSSATNSYQYEYDMQKAREEKRTYEIGRFTLCLYGNPLKWNARYVRNDGTIKFISSLRAQFYWHKKGKKR